MSAPVIILSGGQTGVDRAALDVAAALGVPAAGRVPWDASAEDGPIDLARYPTLRPMSPVLTFAGGGKREARTARNVDDADLLLVLSPGPPAGGTATAVARAAATGKPIVRVDLRDPGAWPAAANRLRSAVGRSAGGAGRPARVNVAGPRASEYGRAYEEAAAFLRGWLSGYDASGPRGRAARAE